MTNDHQALSFHSLHFRPVMVYNVCKALDFFKFCAVPCTVLWSVTFRFKITYIYLVFVPVSGTELLKSEEFPE